MMGLRNRGRRDDEMDDNSMHSVQSYVSTSTATSLQDVELGAVNPQDGGGATAGSNAWNEESEIRCFHTIKSAWKRFLYSDFHGMNPAVICILATEAGERFAYYGFRASLVLYFTQELKMDDTTAISLFAFASYVANFTPIFGAVLGDGKMGRFNTIVAFGFVYWLGLIVLTHAAFLGNYTASQLKVKRMITMCGLALICTGTGGIKPCVSIFGADQVNIKRAEEKGKKCEIPSSASSPASSTTMNSEEQEKVRTFFSFFSMCINLGAVASFAIIPTIKGTFGFGAAFLIPTIFMCLAILIFTSQRHNYVYRPNNPHGSSLFTTFRLCVWLLHNNLWDNKLISENFPSLRPGPVPLPSVLPRTDTTIVEGISVMGDHEDDGSLSSMSISMRSLSRSVERLSPTSKSRSRSRPCQSPDSRATYDTSALPLDHPLRESSRNGRVSGLQVPSRSPGRSMSLRRKKRCSSNSRASASEASAAMSAASLHTTDRYLAQQLADAARALNVLPVFSMLPCFWMLYDQQGSVWTLQASRMNLYGILQPEQINVLNPIGLFLLIPIFDKAIYPALEKHEIDISPLRRMGWGMFLASLAFYISGIVEYAIDYRHQNGLSPISFLWQIPQIGLMTVAEIFISVTGLEFAYSVSPDRLKSFVMTAYLMTIAKGFFWGGVLYSTVFRHLNQAVVLHIFAMLMIINLAFYGYVVRSWELRHGLVSWDLFDRVLENESKQRPCWLSHQRQFLNMPVGGKKSYQRKDTQSKDTVEKPEKSERRGRGRWRRRDAKKEKKSRKSKSRATKKSRDRDNGSQHRSKNSCTN